MNARSFPPLILLIAAVLIPQAGCGRESGTGTPSQPVPLTVSVSPELSEEWNNLISVHPLPEGFAPVETAGGGPELAVDLTPAGTLPELKAEAEKNRGALAGIITYVPVTDIFDPAVQTSSGKITAGDYSVEPAEAVRLPRKGLGVDGKYPGDPDYPLYRGVCISPATGAGKGTPAEVLEAWLESVPEPLLPRGPVWTSAVGDIMPGRGVDTVLIGSPEGIETIFTDTLPVLQSSDLVVGNLETVIARSGVRLAKSYNFRSPPEVLRPLKDTGFDYLSMTNNHCFDYGEDGFIETLRSLEAAGILTSGAGMNEEEARAPAVYSTKGTDFRILSAGAYPREANGFDGSRTAAAGSVKPGILWMNSTDSAAELLSGIFTKESFNIIMVHGGREWQSQPTARQKELYRSFIDNGADLVIGSHPHVLQPMEVYQEKLIAYSLGNFIFPGMEETNYGEESIILTMGIVDNRVLYVEVHPVNINRRILSIDRSGIIKNRFFELSRGRF